VVRIVDDLLRDLVPALAVARYNAHRQCIGVDVGKFVIEIALLFVEERLPVRNQQLHVADLRTIDSRVVHLVQNAVRDGEPCPAGSGVSRAHRVLRARSPPWLNARRAKGRALLIQPVVLRCKFRHYEISILTQGTPTAKWTTL